jgi:hypothetical protein
MKYKNYHLLFGATPARKAQGRSQGTKKPTMSALLLPPSGSHARAWRIFLMSSNYPAEP